jgi:1-deoxy-D-xylulose-5-phosphate reductoisomerase
MPPDTKKFPCLALAFEALRRGGNTACVMNAANEVAVDAFLNERINFADIGRIIEQTMEQTPFIRQPSLNDYIACNDEAARIAKLKIEN